MFNPKAIRAGMWAQFSLKFGYLENLAELKNIVKLQQRILVFEEEANGIQDFSVGEKTMIPTLSDIESLNVAQAATVYLFEGLRQKLIN